MGAMSTASPVFAAFIWSIATVALYAFARCLYRRWPFWWTSPLAMTPVLLLALVLSLHVSYREYIRGTHWLVTLMGPATVAFAAPIYEQRILIRRHWPILLAGVAVGSLAAIGSGWMLASAFGLSDILRVSLLPRSMTTPFAMAVSQDIGGAPDLTAVFVATTGVFGAVIGELILHCLPLRSALARGALFGMGAHGAGVAKARELGPEEGAIAGLVMVMAGVANVLATTLIVHFWGGR
jgi:predicted murein hydrolase (TIGR00659 family)